MQTSTCHVPFFSLASFQNSELLSYSLQRASAKETRKKLTSEYEELHQFASQLYLTYRAMQATIYNNYFSLYKM